MARKRGSSRSRITYIEAFRATGSTNHFPRICNGDYSTAGLFRGKRITRRRGAARRGAIITHGAWKRKESGKNGAFVAPGEDWKPFRNRGLDHFLHDCAGN